MGAGSSLVKVFLDGELLKVHPRKPPGARSTDPSDCPVDRRAYATRDLGHLIATAKEHGAAIGSYVEAMVKGEQPWMRMRQVYRLLSFVRRYGGEAVEAACAKALELDVVDVSVIARVVEQGSAGEMPKGKRKDNVVALRFTRDPGDFKVQEGRDG